MPKNTSVTKTKSQQELEQLRTVILGENHHLITDTVNEQAREIVGEVLTEALHDRQKKDGSVNTVLLPIVENSVEHSVSHHSDRLISSLYPLMGSLVRKSVTAFLSNFIEKTNQLVEHSFTIKGLKWRFKAWQAGVSFTQYVVSQTYHYRVEHVLLIHQETGVLLQSVNLEQQSQTDTDLISSMLTAINDFVGDSFQTNVDGTKEQLQTVSTDNFNLLIKPGPKAIIVAAVTGTPPVSVSEQLQITLEGLHRLYMTELENFNGDNASFVDSENQLRDCLLTEEKHPKLVSKKLPWFTWLLISFVMIFFGLRIQNWYQLEQLNNQIMEIDQQPGIIVRHLEVNEVNDIYLNVMRDPDAIPIEEWFSSHQLPFINVNLVERKFRSLSQIIINQRVKIIQDSYPDLSFLWKNEKLTVLGDIDVIKYQVLIGQLADIGVTHSQLDIKDLKLISSDKFAHSHLIKEQAFKTVLGNISAIQLDFDTANTQVTPAMKIILAQLAEQFSYLIKLANQLNIKVGLLIIGSSDNSGNREKNRKLSIMRAENTASALTQFNLNREKMFVTGLGQIDIEDVKNTSRKVMFNVIYINITPKK